MAFCGSSAWSKVALVLIVVALAVHCAGYGTNYWMARLDNFSVIFYMYNLDIILAPTDKRFNQHYTQIADNDGTF